MSLRAVARSAPRTLSRLSSTAIRQTRIAQPSSLLRTAWAPLRTPQLAAAFSSTPLRQAPANEVDQELLAKLESEVQFESEVKQDQQLPASIKDFTENSPYELKDKPGQQDIYLVRKFGDETSVLSIGGNKHEMDSCLTCLLQHHRLLLRLGSVQLRPRHVQRGRRADRRRD